MNRYLILLILFTYISSACWLDPMPNITQAIEELNVPLETEYYEKVIEGAKQVFGEYAFIDILKSPPEVEGQPGYFPKVDIIKDLDTLLQEVKSQGETYPFYKFNQKLMDIILSAQDQHISFYYTGYQNCTECQVLYDYFALAPVNLRIVDVDGTPKMFAENSIFNTLFGCSEEFNVDPEEVEKVKDYPIESINGVSPFDYIMNFGNKFHMLKNKHGRFTYANMLLFNLIFLNENSVDAEFLENFKIKFSDENQTVIEGRYILVGPDMLNKKKEEDSKFKYGFRKYEPGKATLKSKTPKEKTTTKQEDESFFEYVRNNNGP